MTKIIFIEGVSGVGKTTLVKALQDRWRSCGYTVRSYIEFDFTNPIDFYDYVLNHSVPVYQMMNLTRYGYNAVLEKIVTAI